MSGMMANAREQSVFLVDFEETDAAAAFFLAAKLGKAVEVTHLARFAQQLTESRHLSIDGGVAVASFTKNANKPVQRFLIESAEPFVEEYLVDLTQKRLHVSFVLSFFP
jgi:hypothetical protein